MTLSEAKRGSSGDAFGFACRSLLKNIEILPVYDYIFIDEAQDYNESFIYLCLRMAKKSRVVWGADELQNIFQAHSVSYSKVLDSVVDNNPLSWPSLAHDWVLKKCYRTPREVLVCAHAMGFGFYGRIVQLLENREHWEDLGYVVDNATYNDDEHSKFQLGTEISISRPQENSPKFVDYDFDINAVVGSESYDNVGEEIDAVVEQIVNAVRHEKVGPEDIMVVCADDRNVSAYFDLLQGRLINNEIRVNNTHKDSYGVRDFFEKDRVTLSTIHKAKGNEAYLVFVVGIDALFYNPGPRERNLIFTAMTRTKGWLAISGVGPAATEFCEELLVAKVNYPNFNFRLPSDTQLRQLQRDISTDVDQDVSDKLSAIQNKLPLDDYERVLRQKLAEVERQKNNGNKF